MKKVYYNGEKHLHLNDDRKWVTLNDGDLVPEHLIAQAERKAKKINGSLSENPEAPNQVPAKVVIPAVQPKAEEVKPKKAKKE